MHNFRVVDVDSGRLVCVECDYFSFFAVDGKFVFLCPARDC